MDSLLATYASSSDDEEDQPHHHHSNSNSNSNHNHHETSSFSASLEPSSSSSTNLFNLPQPKSSSSSSLFSSMLPPPKSNQPIRQQPTTNLSSSNQNPKKIVQFRPPLNPSLLKTLNDEDSDEEEEKSRKPIKVSSTQTSSVASFFSSLPAPKSSLGLGSGSSLGAGRKSIIDTNVLPSSNSNDTKVEKKKIELSKKEDEGNLGSGSSSATATTASATTASEALVSGGDGSNWVSSNENYGSYENYGGYVNYENSYGTNEGSYGGSGGDMASVTMEQPTMMIPEFSRAVENVARSQGKRGRNDIPTEIIEVKQDELMKNRPREDQAKMTGIAFGPAYQAASSKGKPSKLHKRKHQIGALYFDMRQKETELSERRSKGFLTKAETQAKYGW